MGVGKKMLEAAIEKAKKLNYKAIVVLGHKEYYSKFGLKFQQNIALNHHLMSLRRILWY